ncbi:RluA family pseudouridine synthase [Holophaga foetida]|uniref:RluA family pseudouridine synthase n=1 Tax=Holophaga foetida TaxID=35839 RepID=UPI00024732D2|nr:RluA family pseudouridine synthase [Holophaga foetida]
MARLNKSWKAETDGTALATELHTILEVSHRQAKGIIDAGMAKVNGEAVRTAGHRLKAGDELAVAFDPDTAYSAIPKPRKRGPGGEVEILWEDKHLIFVNKPAGLLTVPTERTHEACLADSITDLYRRRGFKRFHLYIAHRLDRFTSGVLVFAKTPEALNGLKNLFEEHHLNRIYKAILVGELPENAGTLTGKLVEHSKSLKMSVVQPKKGETKGAKLAITHYRVLERLPGYTVVEVRLETGRRNQIRVQFADRGFPVLGDQVYGQTSHLIDRQALHAELLGIRHPVTDESITVSAPIPKDMEVALKALRNLHRVERAEAGVKGEEGIYKPKITKGRKLARVDRAQRFSDKGADAPAEAKRERPDASQKPRTSFGRPRPSRPGEAEPKRAPRKPAEAGRPRVSGKPKK